MKKPLDTANHTPALLPSRKKNLFAAMLIVVLVFVLNGLGIFGSKFSIDFLIIFEGGYRIMLGQIPYKDFFIPVGPVVFYMQAFCNLILGVNLWSMALHSCLLPGAWQRYSGEPPYKVLSSPPLREPRAIRVEERTSSSCQPHHRW